MRLSRVLAVIAALMISTAAAPTADAATPSPPCVGASQVVPLGVTLARLQLNSCEAQALQGSLDDTATMAGIGGAVGAKWWKIGYAGGLVAALSFYDSKYLSECAKDGRGVSFVIASGIVTGCQPQ